MTDLQRQREQEAREHIANMLQLVTDDPDDGYNDIVYESVVDRLENTFNGLPLPRVFHRWEQRQNLSVRDRDDIVSVIVQRLTPSLSLSQQIPWRHLYAYYGQYATMIEAKIAAMEGEVSSYDKTQELLGVIYPHFLRGGDVSNTGAYAPPFVPHPKTHTAWCALIRSLTDMARGDFTPFAVAQHALDTAYEGVHHVT